MGNRCPHCGEYEMIWMGHDPETGATEPTQEQDASEVVGHSYCRNCDYGVCEFC